jgi:FKBP-type peptidyl-prolyl cis-trans isomerase 2
MSQATNGDTVRVHYTGKLEDGSIFDSSLEREPLQFTIGDEQVIPGFEAVVEGMNTGDTVEAKVPAEEAYGPYRPEMIIKVDHEQFPEDQPPQVGMRFAVRQPGGEPVPVVVAGVDDDGVTLDANHPLAGQTLKFEIQLVEIV